ncbi:MAG TPA: CsgG/HfaB family protein [Holophagaceae bacterium]|nr:CsgG/HfaB family protein [Holophagaceae bacterium]
MRLRKFLSTCAALLLLAAPAFAQKKMSKEEKLKLPRLAILEFKAAPDAWHGWRHGGWGNQMGTISNQLRDLFTTEIMEKGKGKIRLIERERLEEIRGELNFQQSGEVDVNTVQKIGKLLGVKYVMTGKVTRFAYKESGFGTGWGVGALVGKVTGNYEAGAVAGSVNVKKASFTGRLDIRLIEVETGEILGAWKEEDKTSDTSVKVAGTGAEISYDEELVNKVFEPIVQRITPKLLRATGQAAAESED